MSVRKCMAGRVGDSSFQEVLGILEWGPEEATLSVHRGDAEKVFQFAASHVRFLETPTPARASPGSQHDRNPLRDALIEAASWQGALFEYLEGPAPESFAETPGLVAIEAPAAEFVKGLADSIAAGSAPASLPEPGGDALQMIEAFIPVLCGAHVKRPFLRELALCYQAIGSISRSVLCLRQLAAHYADWGAVTHALEVLDRAVKLCPADIHAAEELIRLAQWARETRLAEDAARAVCKELGRLGLGDAASRIAGLLIESPSDPDLKCLMGEARLKRGDAKGCVKELWSAVQAFDASGDRQGTERSCQRILEVDPTHSEARGRLRKLQLRRTCVSKSKRWGTLAAALLIIAAWFSWDAKSASALEALRRSGESMEPLAAIHLVRDAAGKYPVTRHVERIATLERALFERSFSADRQKLSHALATLEEGRLAQADALLGEVSQQSIFQLIRDRARSAANEIDQRRKALGVRLEEASQHLRGHQYEKAFEVHRQVLSAGVDPDILASLMVPLRIETMPAGARVRVAGREAGATPNWVLVPAERECKLEILLSGFTTREILGPVWVCVDRKDPRIRVSLLPERYAEVPAGGGEFATGITPDAPVIPVTGSDGVIRAVSTARSGRWELAPDPAWVNAGPPCMVSKTLVLGSTQGKVFGYAAARGSLLWEYTLGRQGGLVTVGPGQGGVVLATGSGGAALINVETGRAAKQLDVPERRKFKYQGLSGETAVFLLEGGDWIGADVRTGKRVFEQRGHFATAEWILTAGGQLIVGDRDGSVIVTSLDGKAERWRKPFGSRSALAFSGEQKLVVVGTSSGLLFAFQLLTGDTAWQSDLGASITALTVSSAGDARSLIAHTDRRGERVFVAIRIRDGQALWEAPFGPTGASWATLDRGRIGLSSPKRGVLLLKSPE